MFYDFPITRCFDRLFTLAPPAALELSFLIASMPNIEIALSPLVGLSSAGKACVSRLVCCILALEPMVFGLFLALTSPS